MICDPLVEKHWILIHWTMTLLRVTQEIDFNLNLSIPRICRPEKSRSFKFEIFFLQFAFFFPLITFPNFCFFPFPKKSFNFQKNKHFRRPLSLQCFFPSLNDMKGKMKVIGLIERKIWQTNKQTNKQRQGLLTKKLENWGQFYQHCVLSFQAKSLRWLFSI